MTLSTWAWFTLGAIIVYLVAQDPKVVPWAQIQLRLFAVWVDRQRMKILIHPDSPWVQYQIWRNARKIARELSQPKND